jgi:hypothetical protein
MGVIIRNGLPHCSRCNRQVSYRRSRCRACGARLVELWSLGALFRLSILAAVGFAAFVAWREHTGPAPQPEAPPAVPWPADPEPAAGPEEVRRASARWAEKHRASLFRRGEVVEATAPEAAEEYYLEVIYRYPESEEAAMARERLEVLERRHR